MSEVKYKVITNKLWRKPLTYNEKVVGYRYQLPQAGGLCGDIDISDKSLLQEIGVMKRISRQCGEIPCRMVNGGLVTPFEGSNCLQITKENYEVFLKHIRNSDYWDNYWLDVINKNIESSGFDKSSNAYKELELILKLIRDCGSLKIKVSSKSSLLYRIEVEDFRELLFVVLHYANAHSIKTIKPCLNLGNISTKGVSITANPGFIRSMGTILNRLGIELPRNAYDVDKVGGSFGILGELGRDDSSRPFWTLTGELR